MAAKMTDEERRYLDERMDRQDEAHRTNSEKLDAVLTELGEMRTAAAVAAVEAKNVATACEAKVGALRSRMNSVEGNQRWVVLGLLTAFGVALFETIFPGGKK